MLYKFNVNDNIKVHLTDRGQEIYMDELRVCNQIMKKNVVKVEPKKVDENGFSTFQLWDFMNLYGEYFYNGQMKHPIYPLEIYIEDKDLSAK